MNGLALCATLVVLLGSLLYPVFAKIRRGRTDRPEGLYIISEPKKPKDVTFEIVAVHGLGAHPKYTWTCAPPRSTDSEDGKRVHLLELLRDDFPTARILAFAYNSDWLIDAPVKSAQQIGDRLLDKLVEHRSKHLCVPIIFIGHSFGGIIIKQALCNPKDAARDIVDSTCGIVFLGTPHQGSPVSRLGAVAACLTGFFGSNAGLLLALTSYGEQLFDLDERFVERMKEKERRGQKTEIVAFCETKPTRVLGWLSVGLIVPKDSARGGHAAKTVHIDTDHSGLNKCGGRKDQLYTELQQQLHRLRPTTIPILNGNQKFVVGKLRTVEGAAFNSHANEHDATCLEGTRRELLEEINQWADGLRTHEHIYWLQGKAGTGKSTIARTVARDLFARDRLAASFFFKRSESDRGTARGLFTTIATQLARRLPTVAEYMRNAIEADPDIGTMALGEQFRKLILQPLEAVLHDISKTMTVVIDALDECEGDQDVTAIIKLLLQKDRPAVIPLNFFVTSRFEPPIRSEFQNGGKFIEFPLHEIPQPIIERDIESFLKFRLDEIRRQPPQFDLTSNWPDPTKFEELLRKSIPLFIFADTACRFIGDNRQGGGGPDDRLQKILQYEARGNFDQIYLPALYQMIHGLKGSQRREAISDFKKIVGSIVTLTNPLAAATLASLLGISPKCVNNRLYLLHTVLDIPPDTTDPVKIFHESFRDFLLHPDPEDGHEFSVDEKKTHETLADRCLRLLSEGGYLKRNIYGLEELGNSRTFVDQQTIYECLPSEARYACLYWVHHLKSSGVTLHDEHQAYKFLQSHFLHWLEALSLIGRISESIRLIDELQALVDGDHHSAVSDFLYDAKRFILKNRQIADDAPLQLYCSGLIFSPRTATFRREFKTAFPNWVYQLPQVEESWSAGLQTLEGHSGPVNSVAFSFDGRLLASGSYDETIRLWDATTGVQHQTLKGHSDSVRSVVFSPDGRLLASGSSDRTIRLWDTATGVLQQTLKGHLDLVLSVVFSCDGRLLASGSSDMTVRLWDATTGTLQQTLEGHLDLVNSVAFSLDGRLLASCSNDKTVRLWDATTGVQQQTLKGHSGSVRSVVFSPDGRLLASGSEDHTVRLWDATTGALQHILKGDARSVMSVAFSPDGRMLASSSNDRTVRLWDATTGALQQTLKGHSSSVRSVTFSCDGRMLASCSSDKTVRLWDATAGSLRQTLEGHLGPVSSLTFSYDGRMLASGSSDMTVRLWDATTGALQQTLKGHSSSVNSAAFSPDGRILASGSYDETVRLWDTTTGALRQTLERHSRPLNLVIFSHDGRIMASGSSDMTVLLWDATTGALQQTLEGHSGPVTSVAFSCDGRMLASGSDKTVRLWDAATGALQQTLEGHSGPVTSVAFSCDGRMLASSSDKIVLIWDTTTGALQQTLEGHSDLVTSVAFSCDNRVLASSSDKIVLLWDTTMGVLQQTLEGHSGPVTSVAFSLDGRLLASCSNDETVRLWDATTGALQHILEGDVRSVMSVVFSPDGRMLASGYYDKTVRLWDAATGALQQTLGGHSGPVTSVAFSCDSRMLASGSYDKTIRLWDATTGVQQQTIKGHSSSVHSVVFSPDGRLLASGSSDRTVRLWDAATGVLQQTWCVEGITAHLEFSLDGSCLRTNLGSLEIQSRRDTGLPQVNPGILIEQGQWIKLNGERVLWLPPESRPNCSVIHGSVLALGHVSGRISFIGFRL